MRVHVRDVVVLVGIGLTITSCDAADPASWARVRDDAEIVVVGGAGGGTGATGFGAVLLGFGTTMPDLGHGTRLLRASRFAASGGAGGPYSVFPAFDEYVVDSRTTTGPVPSVGHDPRYNGCVAAQFCGDGSSVSFAATAVWHQDPTTTRTGCVVVPSGNALIDSRLGDHHEQVHVRCEPTSAQIQTIDVPVERVELGASAASLPTDHPLGVAIFGAPGDAMGNGRLYRLDDYPVIGFIPVDLPGTPVGAGLGRTLASVALADGSILLATAGDGRPDDPVVVVATLDPAGGTVVRACLRGRGTRFGSALAFGDFDADGAPDLAVGAGVWLSEQAGTQHADQPVAIYAGSDLLGGRARGCEDPPATSLAPARSIDCLGDPTVGFTCASTTNDAYAGFGASLAVADLNADMRDDLVIGVPLSNVHAGGAGVLVVLAGGTSFDAIGRDDHAIVTYSSIGTGAHFGATVSTVPGVDRAEIVAGAPGAGHVALVFCSGLRGDRPQDFAGMSGVTHGCVLGAHPQHDVDASSPTFDAGPPVDAGVDASRVDAGGLDAGDVDAAGVDAGDDAGGLDADVDSGVDAG